MYVTGTFTGLVQGSVFSDNTTTKNGFGQSGAALSIMAFARKGNGDGGILDTVFERNTSSMGGAVTVFGKFDGDIVGSAFTDNRSSGAGGAIVATIRGDITGSAFTGNTAATGGAVYVDRGGTLAFVNPDLVKNAASGKGGAIFIKSDDSFASSAALDFTITDAVVNMYGNTAAGVANAVHMQNHGTMTVDVADGSVFNMFDAVTADVQDAKTVAVVKNGLGDWRLGGDNAFTVDGAGSASFTVNAGGLHLIGASEATPDADIDAVDGAIDLAGAGSSFVMAADTVLGVGGDSAVHTDGGIILGDRAAIAADGDFDTSLELTAGASGAVALGGSLAIDVSVVERTLSLDAAFAQSAAGGTIRKTGDGALNLARADAAAAVDRFDLAEGVLVSGRDQSFVELVSAEGTGIVLTGSDLTVEKGRLEGTTAAADFTKNGSGKLDIEGKMNLTGAFRVTGGEVGVGIDMTNPTIVADSLAFLAGTILSVTGYTGDGGMGETVVIRTARDIADGDMPSAWHGTTRSRTPFCATSASTATLPWIRAKVSVSTRF